MSPLQLLILLTPVVHLACAIWVARDARGRGEPVAGWAIGALVLGVPLALVYALSRPKSR